MILPIVLAGGVGERLWPLSRTSYPKQFINLLSADSSLFQQTIQRIPEDENFLAPVIICHAEYRFLVAQQMQEIGRDYNAIILEPCSRNTAPAIAIAAIFAQRYKDCKILVLPADHNINLPNVLNKTILTAAQKINNQLATFGVKVNRAATEYGYIRADDNYNIDEFIEKPTIDFAQKFYKEQRFFWNSGIFLFQPQAILHELQKLAPDIAVNATESYKNAKNDLDFIRLCEKSYANCPKLSIDYAVMEKTKHAVVFPVDCGWSDMGTWSSVWQHKSKDNDGNCVNGPAITHKSTNCLLHSDKRIIATSCVQDLIIVDTPDAVLVAKRDNEHETRALLQHLKDTHQTTVAEHRKVPRPWGWYDSLYHAKEFQVKHLFVQVNKSLSLQSHKFRSEHWVVVQGRAKVIRGDEVIYLDPNQSTFIPQHTKHQLINIGAIPLEVIEVQSGTYLGEDDIIRYADEHGRITQNV